MKKDRKERKKATIKERNEQTKKQTKKTRTNFTKNR